MIAYEANKDDQNRIFTVKISGKIRIAETRAMGLEIRTLANEAGYGILFDYRLADPSEIKLLDVDNTFKEHYDVKNITLRSIPVVILHHPKHNQIAHFIELSWQADNINTKVTTDEKAAFDWLKSEIKKSA